MDYFSCHILEDPKMAISRHLKMLLQDFLEQFKCHFLVIHVKMILYEEFYRVLPLLKPLTKLREIAKFGIFKKWPILELLNPRWDGPKRGVLRAKKWPKMAFFEKSQILDFWPSKCCFLLEKHVFVGFKALKVSI